MLPTVKLDSAPMPNGVPLELFRHDEDFFIQQGTLVVMSSRAHASEEELARQACAGLADRPKPCVLVGGLGLGYTMAEALTLLPKKGTVMVAEILEPVIRWNREILGHLAGHPMQDPRAQVIHGDVADIVLSSTDRFDGIMLDVDNGPDGLICKTNDRLYSPAGLAGIWRALRPNSVVAVWSAFQSTDFTRRLRRAGFAVTEVPFRPRGGTKGSKSHHIWVARRS